MNKPQRLFDLPLYHSVTYPNQNIFNYKENGVWTGISAQNFQSKVDEISRGLLALGVKKEIKLL